MYFYIMFIVDPFIFVLCVTSSHTMIYLAVHNLYLFARYKPRDFIKHLLNIRYHLPALKHTFKDCTLEHRLSAVLGLRMVELILDGMHKPMC